MKKRFSANEVEELVYNNEVECIKGESRRWSRTSISIVKDGGKCYEVYWEHGLTENQEDSFEAQEASEVEQIEERITIKKWIEKKR